MRTKGRSATTSRARLTQFPELDPRRATPAEVDAEASTDWQTLFRVAGISALTVVVLIPIQGLVYILWPPPTTVVEYFTIFHNNPLLGFLDLDVLLVIDELLIIAVLLALYVALRRVDASMMLIGAAAGLLGATLMIVSREATLSMFFLSQQHALAPSAEARAALEAAGQTLLTIYNGTAFGLGYFLTGLGLLLISTVMLRSGQFSRVAGLSGVAAGVTGLIPASMGTLGFVVSFVSLLPLIVWLFLVGRHFVRRQSPTPTALETRKQRHE